MLIGEDDGKRGGHGYDAGKKISGREWRILVDTLGLLLAVVVHAAAIQDRDGAKLVFIRAAAAFPTIAMVWADGGYVGQLIGWLRRWRGWAPKIVKKLEGQTGCRVPPRHCVAEWTFA